MSGGYTNSIFASNRAEEIGRDVWREFVILPSYGALGIGHTQKPRVVIGGRGCGKTMLLRYLSHESAFSIHRSDYPSDALRHIGLYWKADTHFASMLNSRGKEADIWKSSFDHLTALVLGIEVLRSVTSIAQSKLQLFKPDRLSSLTFDRLKSFVGEHNTTYNLLIEHLEDRLGEFESWANDVRSLPQPTFLPGSKFIERIIVCLQHQLPELKESIFHVYIDEYENLSLYQQTKINTWLKHSEPPLIFNLAMKRNGFKTRDTEGPEALLDIHDYRTIDLEEFGNHNNFAVFAAEILLSKLLLAGRSVSDIDDMILETLRDPNSITGKERRTAYQTTVLRAAESLFPSKTQSELAKEVIEDTYLLERLQARIGRALEKRGESASESSGWIMINAPEASVIVPALIWRRGLPLTQLGEELKQLVSGLDNRFTGLTNWIHNNFVGCYLQLYDGLVRPCPFYSGFHTFCHMARGNLRHLLELCHQALTRSANEESVPAQLQAEAARQVAADFLSEVRSFGPQGNNLHAFLLRLGSVFSLSQQSLNQSEPEKTHFSIKGGVSSLSDGRKSFLSEAVKWSVIFEEKGTKKKAINEPDDIEYIMNPIYASYFHISYRKRRKLEMERTDMEVLIDGSYESVRMLLEHYQKRWMVDLKDAPLPLFAHFDEDEQL